MCVTKFCYNKFTNFTLFVFPALIFKFSGNILITKLCLCFISHFTKFLSFCIFQEFLSWSLVYEVFVHVLWSFIQAVKYFEFWFEFLNFKFARFDLFHIPACSRIWNYFHTRFDFLEFMSFEFLDSRFEFEFKFSRVCDFYIVGCSRKRKKEKEAKRKKENLYLINLLIYLSSIYLDIYLKFNLRN